MREERKPAKSRYSDPNERGGVINGMDRHLVRDLTQQWKRGGVYPSVSTSRPNTLQIRIRTVSGKEKETKIMNEIQGDTTLINCIDLSDLSYASKYETKILVSREIIAIFWECNSIPNPRIKLE